MKLTAILAKAAIPCALLVVAAYVSVADTPSLTVKGYVLDSACAFTKDLSKPISKQCATSCANAGSPLVILADDGTILAYRGHYSIERTKSQASSIRRG